MMLFILSGCGQRNNSNISVSDKNCTISSESFLKTYKNFTEAIQHKSFSELKNIIDTATGIFIIESPGALPVVYNLPDIESFVSQNGKNVFDLFNDKISLEPDGADLPIIDCEYSNGTPYNKTGCFMKSISSDNELDFILISEGNTDDKQKAEAARKKLSMKVINTFNHVYYFTKSGEKWFLTFIDLREPCEA